jgi:hypothetical protein
MAPTPVGQAPKSVVQAPASVTQAPARVVPAPSSPDPWPREIQLNTATLTVYQPQVESWQGNHLDFRAAIAATTRGSNDKTFGVIWGTARTEVDRVWANREQQARTEAENRFGSFQGGGWADRFQGGAWGDRFGAGGWGDRFGEAGRFGDLGGFGGFRGRR